MIVAAGQPIIADDAWMHLARGGLYAAFGSSLSAEPFLFTATAAPDSVGWLSALAFDGIARTLGFQGLRVFHASFVLMILALVWKLTVRVTGTRVVASVVVAILTVLSAYRLFQLRPQLFSIWAVVILGLLILREPRQDERWTYLGIGVLSAFWANIHGGFVLAPILLGAGLFGVLGDFFLSPPDRRVALSTRARYLGIACLAATLGSCLSPAGPGQFLLYFQAGEGTAALANVSDEWARFPFFGWPGGNLPPSPFAWLIVMGLFLGFAVVVTQQGRGRYRNTRPNDDDDSGARVPWEADPALVALSLASLVAIASAVRFLWLGLFPLLLIGAALVGAMGEGVREDFRKQWLVVLCACLIAVGFYAAGPWSVVGQFTASGWSGYLRPYQPQRYLGHAVWFARDVELAGRAFNPYFLGNYLSYWTTPAIRIFQSGSLAMSDEVLQDGRSIIAHTAGRGREGLEGILDRYEVDLFFGVGLPDTPRTRRPWHYSTTHLEASSKWILVFRNIDSAIYLRRNARNEGNLNRVAAYYRENGVPFERERGFDVGLIIGASPAWAAMNGVAPRGLRLLAASARRADSTQARRAREVLASQYLGLGLYERALALDVASAPERLDERALRRIVWALLRVGRLREAGDYARHLEAMAGPGNRLSLGIVDTALAAPGFDVGQIQARIARLPLFEKTEVSRLLGYFEKPEPRPARRDFGSPYPAGTWDPEAPSRHGAAEQSR